MKSTSSPPLPTGLCNTYQLSHLIIPRRNVFLPLYYYIYVISETSIKDKDIVVSLNRYNFRIFYLKSYVRGYRCRKIKYLTKKCRPKVNIPVIISLIKGIIYVYLSTLIWDEVVVYMQTRHNPTPGYLTLITRWILRLLQNVVCSKFSNWDILIFFSL